MCGLQKGVADIILIRRVQIIYRIQLKIDWVELKRPDKPAWLEPAQEDWAEWLGPVAGVTCHCINSLQAFRAILAR